jgi:ABC-type transporter Mla subunit MlaD
MAEITIRISDKAFKIVGVLLCGTVLVWVLFSLEPSGFFFSKYQLSVYVREASGLTVNAPVRLDGVDVGTVSAIRLARESAGPQRRIELVLRVKKADQGAIRGDSSATLVSEGLLGNRYVDIRRGFNGTVIKPGGETPSMPSEVLTLEGSLKLLGKALDCIQQGKNSRDVKTPAPTEPASKSRRD